MATDTAACEHEWDTFNFPWWMVVHAVKKCRNCGADLVVWSRDVRRSA